MTDEDYEYMKRCLGKGVADTDQQQDAAERIEELEAKLALTEPFVRDFVFRAKTSEHTEDDIKLLSEDNLRFERDCDITKARGVIAELTGGKDE